MNTHGVTMIFTESDFPSLVARTSDDPTSDAVISPVDVTATRVGSELDQATSRPSSSLPEASRTIATSCID